ncbi:hypothetical protein CCAND93_60025 [Capnocytophaga canis]|uniref:Uncharacterized protein n=1 Tax=Capnocytophaga canis TaxID=1848903 RepID=A0A0B7IPV9_9FLAO|nr:hypothetical protein CCAND93_60025 [Capnocytophaga canis]
MAFFFTNKPVIRQILDLIPAQLRFNHQVQIFMPRIKKINY